MIRSKICLVADGVIRDAQTNVISIFNLTEVLVAQGFPLLIQKLSFFALWEKEPNDPNVHQGAFSVAMNDKPLMSQEIHIDFQENLRNRTIIVLGGLVIPEPGTLAFTLSLKDGAQARYVVEINAVATAEPSVESTDVTST